MKNKRLIQCSSLTKKLCLSQQLSAFYLEYLESSRKTILKKNYTWIIKDLNPQNLESKALIFYKCTIYTSKVLEFCQIMNKINLDIIY